MSNMRDDERYPTAVVPDSDLIPAYQDIPEAVSSPGLDYHGHDKLSVPNNDKHPPSYASGSSKEKKICGLRRKIFLVTVALVIVLGAVVGGVVGGLAATGRLGSNKGNSEDEPPSIPSSTANPAQESGPIHKTQRAVAASVFSDSKSSDVQVFYQALDKQDISYRRIINDKAKPEQKASLKIQPAWGTPMAAAAINGSNPLRTQIFYLSIKDNMTDINEATFECQADSESCSTVSNTVISESIGQTIHPDTKLSALRLGKDLLRVFYQKNDNTIHALNGDDQTEWHDNKIMDLTYPGTGIVSVAAERKAVYLFYVGLKSKTLRIAIYDDQLGPEALGTEIDSTPGSDWKPTNGLTGVHVDENAPFRCYYAQPKNGEINAYWLNDTKWTGTHNESWGRVEGGFAGVGWSNQVRLYYFQDGKLVVNAQNNITWEKPLIV